MINPVKMMKLKKAWETFTGNHPKFPKFIEAVKSKGLQEGSVIEITVTTASGETLSSNLKVTMSDVELISDLKDIAM
ncbi:hypothetical protein [Anaerocolumna xylanovorans]|uniref:Uncharacterized protein n=1 Tax=Anaerocolumna xylanovorans DSM 12503 TaxID=1121345 RepID=A0A1M7YNG4_9FIRM|nr:hypothetical protein [Anaerocolumna xylanovorans]SHO54204.1 hypothetical protein SAMN02745217_04660 [Anaerocolumna xylanovorans DSM 12503]